MTKDMTEQEDAREGMIETLSVMLIRDREYFETMDDRRLAEEYDRYMKMNEG